MASTSFDDRDGLIWFNGEMVPWREANLHVLSHALHYASAVFEGERAYGGVIFKLTEHSERLLYSARCLGFEIPFTVSEIAAACRDVCAANGIVDGYVRPLAWRGSEMMGVSAQATRINVSLANTLTAFAENGAVASIRKDEVRGLAVKVVPEPGTALLMGLGLAGLAAGGRRAQA